MTMLDTVQTRVAYGTGAPTGLANPLTRHGTRALKQGALMQLLHGKTTVAFTYGSVSDDSANKSDGAGWLQVIRTVSSETGVALPLNLLMSKLGIVEQDVKEIDKTTKLMQEGPLKAAGLMLRTAGQFSDGSDEQKKMIHEAMLECLRGAAQFEPGIDQANGFLLAATCAKMLKLEEKVHQDFLTQAKESLLDGFTNAAEGSELKTTVLGTTAKVLIWSGTTAVAIPIVAMNVIAAPYHGLRALFNPKSYQQDSETTKEVVKGLYVDFPNATERGIRWLLSGKRREIAEFASGLENTSVIEWLEQLKQSHPKLAPVITNDIKQLQQGTSSEQQEN
jgi:hypothetical protein